MIQAYQKLWANRSDAGSVLDEAELEKKIQIELNDELTHPRVRKSRQEKLEIALKRIQEADLTEEEKAGLSELYQRFAGR